MSGERVCKVPDANAGGRTGAYLARDAVSRARATDESVESTGEVAALPAWPFRALGDLGARVKTADEKLAAVTAIAAELLTLPDWIENGHRVSDYGHDLMIALGNPDLPAFCHHLMAPNVVCSLAPGHDGAHFTNARGFAHLNDEATP